MKKTFTNGEMWLCCQIAAQLAEKGKLGYAIAKNTRKFKTELTEYIEKRDELLKKYGTKSKDKVGQYLFAPAAQEQYEAELKEYSELTAEVDIMQVSEHDFISGTLTNTQMDAFMWMIQENKES